MVKLTMPELVCPAGSLPALRAGVDNGADAVYLGLQDATNARNFPGLNFTNEEIRQGIDYAHQHQTRVFLALNTYPQSSGKTDWTSAVDVAAAMNVDAVILADAGLLGYAAEKYPELRRHLSVQASATNRQALAFYRERFGVQRAVLPRVLSLSQVRSVIKESELEIEVFAFGSLCVMVEGRCALSSYVTGESPNTCGVCSPAHAVRWEELPSGRQVRLNGVLIDRYAPEEPAGYPTLCKGRYSVSKGPVYAIEEPTSLSVLDMLPELIEAGVSAIKVEGRQRSPAYVAQVTRVLRAALDSCANGTDAYRPEQAWRVALDKLSEGQTHTLGALDRPWQ